MSTIEATVSVMEELPEETRKQVLLFATYQLNATKPKKPISVHTDDELITILDHSDQQYHDGKAVNMRAVITQARKQHGFI